MLNREDLVFATCYQLAQLTAADWEDQPSAVTDAIDMLNPIDEPGEPYWGGTPLHNPLRLTPSEAEPESIRKSRKVVELRVVTQCFRVIMKHSDGWETDDSDILKKEIVARIANYEKESTAIITPVPFTCKIKV